MKNEEYIFNIDFNLEEVPAVLEKDMAQLAMEENLIIIEEKLKNARAEEYSKGFARGFEEGAVIGEIGALTKSQQHIEIAFVKIYEDVNALLKQEYLYDQALTEMVLTLSSTIIKKIFPHYSNKYGVDEMEHAIRYILLTLLDHQDISIFLAPNIRDDIYERIADIQTCIPNKITLHIDDKLREWECRVDWKGGGARWSQPELIDNIQGLFTRFIQSTDSNKEVSK